MKFTMEEIQMLYNMLGNIFGNGKYRKFIDEVCYTLSDKNYVERFTTENPFVSKPSFKG